MQVSLSAVRQISRAASVGGSADRQDGFRSLDQVCQTLSIDQLIYLSFANESKGGWSLLQVKNGPASKLWLATDL